MLFFLKVVAAVIVALCLLIVLGFWLIRRWIRKIRADVAASARLIDDQWMRPARLRLTPVTDFEPSDDLASLWIDLHGRGFRRLGDFHDEEQGIAVRAACDGSGTLGAALVQWGQEAVLTLFAIDRQRGLVALSAEAGTDLQLERLVWRFDPRLTAETAIPQLMQQVQHDECVKLDIRAFRVAWEQAHAARADHLLRTPPTRETVEHVASTQTPSPPQEQIDRAYELWRSHWQDQLQIALLDHYRRSTRLDAVSWEEIKDTLQVVHEHVDEGQIESLLVHDEAGAHVLKQCSAQGFKGIALYEQVLQRLPGAAQRQRVGEVDQPVHAVLYSLRDTVAGAPSGRFFYEATRADGVSASGTLVGTSSADAIRQAEAMGLRDVRIVLEPSAVATSAHIDLLDPVAASVAVRAMREGLLMSVWRALRANAWIWVPPAALLAWILSSGTPLGWGGWSVVLYALGALAALIFLIGPMVLYNQLLRARLAARWRTAAICLAVLRRLNVAGAISRQHLDLEHAKILAGQGRLSQAVAAWKRRASETAETDYHLGLSQIFDAAGEHRQMINAQRAALTGSPTKELVTVDLAMSLARHGDPREAERLLSSVEPGNLSQLALAGYRFARGVLLAGNGQHETALREYAQAISDMEGFRSNPLILGLIAETNAYAAISFKRLGQADRAGQLWRHVWPILRVHRGMDRLAQAYEAAR